MTSVDTLAREIADLRRQVAALSRAARLPRTSIDAGALTVNNAAGDPVLTVGATADGRYAVEATNGGEIIANTLDVPPGSITETDVSDGAVSTPKLAANAVTADRLSANAIDGRVITGSTLAGGEVITAAPDGTYVHITTDPVDGAVIEVRPPDLPDPNALIGPGRIVTGLPTGVNRVATAYVGPTVNGAPRATLELVGSAFGGDAYLTGRTVELITTGDANHFTAGAWTLYGPAGPGGWSPVLRNDEDGLWWASATAESLAVNALTVGGQPITGGPGGDPAAARGVVALAQSASAVSAATAETRDAGVGVLEWTAEAGRRYRVEYTCRVAATAAGTAMDLRIRDGGASNPTTSSPLLAASSHYVAVAGGAGQHTVIVSQSVPALAAGTHRIAAYFARTAGSGSVAVAQADGAARELRVIDDGPV